MKYIYLCILISLFSAYKPKLKADIQHQKDKISISYEDVSTLEKLSRIIIEGKNKERLYQDLNDNEKTQVKNIMTNFIAQHKEDFMNMFKIVDEKNKKTQEDLNKVYDDMLNNPEIDDDKSPKKNMIKLVLIVVFTSFYKDLETIKNNQKYTEPLIKGKKYTELNKNFSLGLSDEEINSIEHDTSYTTKITINNKKIDLNNHVQFKLDQHFMVKVLIKLNLPTAASLYAKAKTEEDIENTKIPDESLLKGMTVKQLFENLGN